MPYTPPPAPFRNNTNPVGGGLGPAIDAATLNNIVGGIVDNQSRIVTLEGNVTTAVAGTPPTDATALVQALFTGTAQRIYFPAGTYTLSSRIEIARSVDVVCHPNAVFVLAGFARCWMFNFVGDDTTTVTWTGGQVDGNDINQGDEAADGANFDICKGFRFVKHKRVEVSAVYMRSIRGHAINHWNNTDVYFHDINFAQDISQIDPLGGRRRDGITGSSTNIRIERISGFTNDDMVAVIAGATWGGTGTTPAPVSTVLIRDIRCGSKLDIDGTTPRYTWHGVALYSMGGAVMTSAVVENVTGDTQAGHVRAGGYSTNYYGTIKSLTLRGINGSSRSSSLDASLITLGGSSAGGQSTLNTVSITDVNRNVTVDNPLGTIGLIWHVIDTLTVSNAVVTYETGTTTRQALVIESGNGYASLIEMTNTAVLDRATPTSTALKLYNKNTTDTTNVSRVRIRNGDFGPIVAGANKFGIDITAGCKVSLYADDVLANYSALAAAVGASCYDKSVGLVFCDTGESWRQRLRPVYGWNSTTYGTPTAGRWTVGMENVVTSSPFGECVGYRCITGGLVGSTPPPVFEPISPTGPSALCTIDTTFTPTTTNVTPGTTMAREVPTASAAAFPSGLPGIFTTYIGKTSLLNSWQEYRAQAQTTFWRRSWNGTAWTAWTQVNT